MKERPILFSAPMVRAILDGNKTQTRRTYKVRKHPDAGCEIAATELVREPQHVIDRICPYGQSGDRLWVREAWFDAGPFKRAPLFAGMPSRFAYRADGASIGCHKWKPSIHMPRAASRILLEVTGVRVERLNDCSAEDAYAEGAAEWAAENAERLLGEGMKYRNIVEAYKALWEQINGASSWDTNPWVWVIEFRRIK